MKAMELIKQLQAVDGDFEVLIHERDEHGNYTLHEPVVNLTSGWNNAMLIEKGELIGNG